MLPNFSYTIVSINLLQSLTFIECLVLNLIDGFIDEDMSDMLRSPSSPVDENITVIIVYCVVRHDLSGLVAVTRCAWGRRTEGCGVAKNYDVVCSALLFLLLALASIKLSLRHIHFHLNF